MTSSLPTRETMSAEFAPASEPLTRYVERGEQPVPASLLILYESFAWMVSNYRFRSAELWKKAVGTFEDERDLHRQTLSALIAKGESLIQFLKKNQEIVSAHGIPLNDMEATLALLRETDWLQYGPKPHPERLREIEAAVFEDAK